MTGNRETLEFPRDGPGTVRGRPLDLPGDSLRDRAT